MAWPHILKESPDTQKGTKRRHRLLTTTILLFCILPIASLSAVLYTYWNLQKTLVPFQSGPPSIESHNDPPPSQNHHQEQPPPPVLVDRSLLHPEDHIYREATTLFFDWNITVGPRYADGVKKDVYLVNGQFPGPTIEARSGDTLVIRVHNSIPNEGVSIHCHGLELLNQNAYDGASGVTQCPIPPSASFNYTIAIGDDEHGTFWWHGHAQMHRGDGLYGGLVVHQPRDGGELEYGLEQERLLLVGDWFHRSSPEVMQWYQSPSAFAKEPIPDSMVVNGRGAFNCSMAAPARPLDCIEEPDRETWSVFGEGRAEGKVRLRVVNVGTMSGVNFAVSGMKMQPLEVDGGGRVQVTSEVDAMGVLYPGERVDVTLSPQGDGSEGSERLFISLDDENFVSVNPSLQRNQSFPLYSSSVMGGPASWSEESTYTGLADLKALEQLHMSEDSEVLKIVVYAKTQVLAHKDNKPLGFINNTSWEPQQHPLILSTRDEWAETQFVPFIPFSPSSSSHTTEPPHQQWVELTINNLDDGPHPFHLHGHNFYLVSRYAASSEDGWGSFNPFGQDEPPNGRDLKGPLRKDTAAVPRRGHAVVRFRAENPGIWMLHCHMIIHEGTGMGMSLHVGEAEDNKVAAEVATSNVKALDMCRGAEV